MPDENLDNEHESPVIRELRAKAKRADDLEPEVTTLRQENAILKAGITDLTPAKQKALLAAHEGDLDAEALRTTAIDLGFLAKPEDTSANAETQVPAEEQAAHKRMEEATGTAPASEAHPLTLDDQLANAKSADEITAILERAGLANVEP